MSDWWHQAPRGQRFILLGIVFMLFILCLQNFVWSPLEASIGRLQGEITTLTNTVHSQHQKLEELKGIEAKVSTARQQLALDSQQTRGEHPIKTFRQEVAEVATHTQVVLHVWKENEQKIGASSPETSIPVHVRVEGNFQEIRNFLGELASLPRVKRIDSVVISPKPGKSTLGVISVDIEFRGLSPDVFRVVRHFLSA